MELNELGRTMDGDGEVADRKRFTRLMNGEGAEYKTRTRRINTKRFYSQIGCDPKWLTESVKRKEGRSYIEKRNVTIDKKGTFAPNNYFDLLKAITEIAD